MTKSPGTCIKGFHGFRESEADVVSTSRNSGNHDWYWTKSDFRPGRSEKARGGPGRAWAGSIFMKPRPESDVEGPRLNIKKFNK